MLRKSKARSIAIKGEQTDCGKWTGMGDGTSLTYAFVLLVIALEMADVETPSCRATSAKGIP